MYQAQRAQVRVAQNAFSYGKIDKSKPYQTEGGSAELCDRDVGDRTAEQNDAAKVIGIVSGHEGHGFHRLLKN